MALNLLDPSCTGLTVFFFEHGSFFLIIVVHDKNKSAVYISGLVTFIAAYHYIRIFNS